MIKSYGPWSSNPPFTPNTHLSSNGSISLFLELERTGMSFEMSMLHCVNNSCPSDHVGATSCNCALCMLPRSIIPPLAAGAHLYQLKWYKCYASVAKACTIHGTWLFWKYRANWPLCVCLKTAFGACDLENWGWGHLTWFLGPSNPLYHQFLLLKVMLLDCI